MSYQVIEGQGTWSERPFSCSAHVGYPRGHIEIQADFNGTFITILSPTEKDTDFALSVNRTLFGTECDLYEYISFAIKASVLTIENHNKKLRCLVVPDSEISLKEAVFSEGRIMIVESK